jgi:hypothetical protein
VVELLRNHAGEGRLELDELEQRVEAALGARTRGELDGLLADLPGRLRRGRPRRMAGPALVAGLMPVWAGIAILVLAPPAVAWVGWVVIGCWFFAGMPRHRRTRRTVVV